MIILSSLSSRTPRHELAPKPSYGVLLLRMRIDFGGRHAVVTGGSNGIGKAIATALASANARVTIFDLEKESPQEIGKSLGGHGFAVDLTNRVALEGAFAQLPEIEILAANAGTEIGRAHV